MELVVAPATTKATEKAPLDPEGKFMELVYELIKTSLPRDWEALDAATKEKLEQQIKRQLIGYKNFVVANKKMLQGRNINQIIVGQGSSPQTNMKASKKAKTKLGIFQGKKGKSEPPTQVLLSPIGASSSPLVKLAKNISELACNTIKEVYGFIKHFNDPSISWVTTTKPAPRDENADNNAKSKVISSIKKIVSLLKENTETYILNVQSYKNPDSDSAIERVKTRITAELSKTPEVWQTDQKLFTQGQYLRYMQHCLLESMFILADNLFQSTSQFQTVLIHFREGSTSHVYHYCSTLSVYLNVLYDLWSDAETLCFLIGEQKRIRNESTSKSKLSADSSSTPIWKEPEEPSSLDKRDKFRAGSINSILVRLTSKEFTSELMNAFLAGYELFSSSQEVWLKLEERYFVPKNAAESTETPFVKMRVANVILQWVKSDFHSIDSSVLASIEHFAEKTLKKDKFFQPSTLIQKELHMQERFSINIPSEKLPPPSKIPHVRFQEIEPYEVLLFGNRHLIAEQLTLIEFEIFQRISRIELTDQRFSKDKFSTLTKNVVTLIQRVNKLSFFVATSILLQKKLKDRTKVMSRVIGIAKSLCEIHNFNSLFGILAGLGMSPISRLRHTWAKISEKQMAVYRQLEQYQDPSNSFKFLRDQMKLASGVNANGIMNSTSSAIMPYVGTYMSDLTFIDEGNPLFVEVEKMQLINMQKQYLVNRTIQQILQTQKKRYDYTPSDPIYTFLHQMPILQEKELFALSLEREPRDSLPKDIE
eukprot:TRINITY_DN2020_c0_g1_i2.p1 TRINITY_DN2020_c0_g1~~TRINITY_DN2020_c0_g1_i2.p1  ORF type:complete len:764 (-),score=149.88 TRINITY_DN2020_c0_g1_i2:55-2346(-)